MKAGHKRRKRRTPLVPRIVHMMLKPKQIQSNLLIKIPVHFAVDDLNDHLAGGADCRFVQMTAEDMAFVVAGTHVQMTVKFIVHGVDGSREGYNLKAAVKCVGVIFFLVSLEDAGDEMIDGAESLHTGKLDILLKGDGLYLFQNLFAFVDARDDRIVKSSVFHGSSFGSGADGAGCSEMVIFYVFYNVIIIGLEGVFVKLFLQI